MFTEALFLTAFGQLLITGCFLSFYWGEVSWRRARQLKQEAKSFYSLKTLLHDRYMLLAASLCVNSVGTTLFGAYVVNIIRGAPLFLQATTLLELTALMGILIMVASKFGFSWAVCMNHKNKAWLALLVFSVAWALFSFWWVF